MTGKYVLDREQAHQQIRESMRRVNEFCRNHPVGPCPECGKPSRLARASGGPCLSCTIPNWSEESA
jgi:hypothetical protein